MQCACQDCGEMSYTYSEDMEAFYCTICKSYFQKISDEEE